MEQKAIPQQPTLHSDRIDLRPLRRSDAGLLDLYASDERVARMTRRIAHPHPPGATEAFIERILAGSDETVWAMDGQAAGWPEVVGLLSLVPVADRQCELHYWVAPAHWGHGVATEAVRCLLNANPLGCQTLFAEVFQDNPASARVLTNAGFTYLGDAETFSVARDAAVPTWTYSRKMG